MHVPLTEVLLIHDGVELARATLPPGEYVIGREAGVELHANTPLLSRQHARLTINYDRLIIEDLGSSNGTFVNDQPVTDATRLFPNQSIRLGPDITLEVRRQRAPTEPEVSLAPAQAAIRRFLPDDVLAEKRYAIGNIIARGGMGAILDARQRATQRTVAMKVMLDTGDEADVLRFIEEAQVTAQLDHPNIVPIYELGVDEQDQLFYTMKMVRGITLKKVLDLLAQGVEATVKKYPLPVLLTIFQKASDAIAFAHAKGVIHRDLKPENIMLGDFGSVLVMDWGLAKVLAAGGHRAIDFPPHSTDGPVPASAIHSARTAAPELSATMTGSIMGTPAYMSPEQARGEIETLDARSDIYALGAILYEILALRPSVIGAEAMQIVDKVARGEIEPLECGGKRQRDAALAGAERRGDAPNPDDLTRSGASRPSKAPSPLRSAGALQKIPDSLAAVVRKAMAFDAAARYPRVEDLQADLLAYQNGFATSAEKAGAWKQFTLLIRRNKAIAGGIAAVLLVGTVLGTHAILEGRRAEHALTELRKAAPTFAAQARSLVERQMFAEAIEKLDFAIAIDPREPSHRRSRADLLQASLRLAEAEEEYRRVLAAGADAHAQENLALTTRLLAAGGEPDAGALRQLYDALHAQGRALEAVQLGLQLGLGAQSSLAAIEAACAEWMKLPEWKKLNDWMRNSGMKRITRENDGTFSIRLSDMPVQDLAPLERLRGIPIGLLNIDNTLVREFSSLAGLPLRSISATNTPIADLAGLRSLPLKSLSLQRSAVTDLAPLAGLPLTFLNLSATKVKDLAPLAGMPLRKLDLRDSKVTDLTPLAGVPIEELVIAGSGVKSLRGLEGAPLRTLDANVAQSLRELAGLEGAPLEWAIFSWTDIGDISALRGSSVRSLDFGNGSGRADLAVLATCPNLRTLSVDKVKRRGIEALRGRSEITFYVNGKKLTAAEFWEQWDTQQAAGKK